MPIWFHDSQIHTGFFIWGVDEVLLVHLGPVYKACIANMIEPTQEMMVVVVVEVLLVVGCWYLD